ncbi:sodium-coupled monocarboxylate transporter 1-like [Anticarsia gemmatalis]|uniref:sodium-coupled monocarboxylate transporter 1-like n=1 Tax=Anticarsia gemmatalis TaxID=129554 RepID=UPI003F75DC52
MAQLSNRIKLTLANRNEVIVLITVCSISSLISFATAAPNITIKEIDNISLQNETEAEVLFHWEDYTVLAAMLLISCMIGVFYGYFGEKQTTGDDFLLGGSSMGTFPMAMSLGASFVTAIELLGNPAEMYMAGAQFWMICVSFVLVVPIASHLYLPVFMRLRLTSCYEYLEVRFCKSIRVYASALYMMQMILYTAVAVYAPALALSDVTGLNTYLAVSLVYVVCIFYASQGGMKAVIMTDSFQSAVLIGSLAVVLAMSSALVGGFDIVWEHAWRTNRLHFFDMNPDPTVRHSFWSVVIGGTLYWVSMFCANQASVQKYLSVERIAQVRVALWVSAIIMIAVYSVNFITGAVLAVHYADCDPIQAGMINASDRLLPLYVVHQLGGTRGVPGFFVAGIFAASLGTVASALNSLAAIACQDLATGLLGITLPEDKGATIARWVCLGCGVVSFGLVFAVERLGPVLQLALSFNGMAGGVALGLFSLGMFFPWANAKGAVAGGVFGLLVVVAAGGGAQFAQLPMHRLPASTDGCDVSLNTTYMTGNPEENRDDAVFWLFRVSYLWYSGLGCAATLVAGLVVSVVTGTTDPAHVPIDLISPPIVKLLNSLPKKFKRALKVPTRLGSERRRSSSVRPPSMADDKDTRRRRRLSELAGGVFYSDAPTLTRGYDNFALGLDPEKPPPDSRHKSNSIKLESTSDIQLPETSTC